MYRMSPIDVLILTTLQLVNFKNYPADDGLVSVNFYIDKGAEIINLGLHR